VGQSQTSDWLYEIGLGSQTVSLVYTGMSSSPPSSAAVHLKQSDFAGSRGTRVDVSACVSKRRQDLRKTSKIKALTHQASPDTLARVQRVLAQYLGLPSYPPPETPLMQIGFELEGFGSIGFQHVADTVISLEDEFDIELLTILVNTWVKLDVPPNVHNVQDLASFVESKMRA